ncbi:hypothetical protein EVAR_41597_1 [Eumeta japonica]|uniref:Uncharacterized protein n=1 Tax=Eumeta variegata TaxID=151549 RepID=A0A4C1Y2K9_EUMVA|nr:hypothetical protein EVAR_41597_1 [Eumeta japonica]
MGTNREWCDLKEDVVTRVEKEGQSRDIDIGGPHDIGSPTADGSHSRASDSGARHGTARNRCPNGTTSNRGGRGLRAAAESMEKKLEEEEGKHPTAEGETRLVRPPHWSTSSRI